MNLQTGLNPLPQALSHVYHHRLFLLDIVEVFRQGEVKQCSLGRALDPKD